MHVSKSSFHVMALKCFLCFQEIDNSWKKLISAKFLMVARNPVTKG